MADRIVSLHGRDQSLVIECPAEGPPLWRYWGQRLDGDFACGPPLLETRPTPSFSLDQTVPFSLFPTFGLGWFGQSALLAHRQGSDFAQGWTASSLKSHADGLICTLEDAVAGVSVYIDIALDPATDVLSITTSLTNIGEGVLDLHWLAAASLPLPDTADRVRYFTGRHNGEFVQQTDPLGRALWRRENRRGLTSHDTFPGALVLLPGTTEHEGLAYGAQLAWSGNTQQQIEWLDDGRYQWQLGEWLAPGEVRLAPGETLRSPVVRATCSTRGPGGVAANFQAAVRAARPNGDRPLKPRPVLINTWEGYYFNHDPHRLMQLADAAASVGIERFVLDDGWFHGRDDDTSALGDWWVDASTYPDGLAPLARHVTSLGMEFGLWVEPEMVNPDSELFRAHPEWALQIAGRPLATARNQLVLDLTRADVTDYLFDRIGALIAELKVSYIKWDHNRDLAAAGDAEGKAAYRQQIAAVYALLGRFRSAFPDLEIESCAGGGGRIDAGIAPYVERFWTSDCIDALLRIDMQKGFLQFMPPEMMGAHIGASPCHSTGRSFPIAFQAAVACQGHLGVELDLLSLDDKEKAELADWIAFYKQWRPLLHGGDSWSGSAGDGLFWHAAGDASEWLLFVYRTQPMQLRHAAPVRLPFVIPGLYDVRRADPGESPDERQFDGSWLRQAGLPVPPGMPQTATIWHGQRR